jgi:hypothetical protein
LLEIEVGVTVVGRHTVGDEVDWSFGHVVGDYGGFPWLSDFFQAWFCSGEETFEGVGRQVGWC